MRTVSKILLGAGGVLLSCVPSVWGQNTAPAEADAAASVAVSSGYEEAMKRYGAKSVDAIQVNGPNQYLPIILDDLTIGGLVYRMPNLDSPITIPEDQLTFKIGYKDGLNKSLYASLNKEGKQAEARELIRAEVYPLLKFVPIDPQTIQIHRLVGQLLDELISAGEIDEAAAIMEQFPKARLVGYFRPQAVEVAAELVNEGEIDRAYTMVKQFPLGPGQLDFAKVYLNLANEFRLRSEWEKSRNLYKDVQLSSSPSETPEAFLWEAYIHLQEGRDFMVDGVLDQFGEIDTTSRYFSLYELVHGVVLEKRGQSQEALSSMAKGLVYSTTNDPWTPELLYRTADLYESQDFPGAASEIRDQLRFFYPDSIWAERLGDENS